MKLILALATITLLTACGGGGDDSNNNTQATTDTPQTPSAPTATVESSSQINLSWSSVSGVSYYRLSSGDSEIYAGSNTSYNHEELDANTAYSYTLKACTDSDTSTCSDASSAISATTQDDTQTTLQTPSAPTATVESSSQINLSWSSVSGVSYYRLSSGDSEIYAGGNTSYNHEELEANTAYSYTLQSCTDSNSNTCSDASSATSATTTQLAKLNDTGVIVGANSSTAHSSTCNSNINAPQDCHQGRDRLLTAFDSTFTYATNGSKIAKVGAGAAGFDFTKLSSTGTTLLATAGSWSCVKDNVTGLVWEVKTDLGASDTFTTNDGVRTYIGGNIHHKGNTYRWGGLSAVGKERASREGEYYDDWNVLVNGSNSDSLCGFNDWRVPTINELDSIVNRGRVDPSIDSNYFPNTVYGDLDSYWSSSPYVNNATSSLLLNFDIGRDGIGSRNYNYGYRVRLVRFGE